MKNNELENIIKTGYRLYLQNNNKLVKLEIYRSECLDLVDKYMRNGFLQHDMKNKMIGGYM